MAAATRGSSLEAIDVNVVGSEPVGEAAVSGLNYTRLLEDDLPAGAVVRQPLETDLDGWAFLFAGEEVEVIADLADQVFHRAGIGILLSARAFLAGDLEFEHGIRRYQRRFDGRTCSELLHERPKHALPVGPVRAQSPVPVVEGGEQ